MFQVLNQNLPLDEEEEEFIEEYLTEEELDIALYEDVPDTSQFVEVTNPEFLETMLSNNASNLEALLDFQADLSNLNLIKVEPQDFSYSTPQKTSSEPEVSTPVSTPVPMSFNQMIFGEDTQTTAILETPDLEGKRDPQTPARKTYGGKSIILYERYEIDEEIDILGVEVDEEPFSPPINSASKKKRKMSSSQKSKSKKNKTKSDEIEASVVYNILTQLDTPPTKAKTLEKNISKVFMGEELIKMKKNGEEDEIIEII